MLAKTCAALISLAARLDCGDQLPVFADIRPSTGVAFRHHASPTDQKFLVETMGGGVAVFDFDNDGLLDLFFVNGGTLVVRPSQPARVQRTAALDFNRLYRNLGGRRFEDVTEQAGLTGRGHGYGMGVATGDFDNDGNVDLYVTCLDGNILYRNKGNGSFEDVTARAGVAAEGWSASAGFFDFDNDGLLDLFVARYLDWDFSRNILCGHPFRTYCQPNAYPAITNLLYRNNGDGTFTDVSQRSGVGEVFGKNLGVAFHDYNGDGFADVLVANDSVAQLLFRNNRDGTFTEVAHDAAIAFNEDGSPFSGMGVDFNDYDNDGLPDVVITNLAKELYALYRNDGGGLFTYRTRTSNLGRITALLSGWGARFVDLDHDGWKDLFVTQGHVLDNVERADPALKYRQPPLLAKNERGRFRDVSADSGPVFRRPVAGRGAAFGDLDNDGDIDIVTSLLDDHPQLILNNASESGCHWLILRTEGTRSNRQGIGARIKITSTAGVSQYGYVTTAGSYLSANDSRVHFGLGGDSNVASVEVLWPSGVRQSLTGVAANQILTIREPEWP